MSHIDTHYGVWAKQTISFVSHEKAGTLAKVDPADLIITNTSTGPRDPRRRHFLAEGVPA